MNTLRSKLVGLDAPPRVGLPPPPLVPRVAAGEVTEEELARCRTRLKAARPMGKQTIGARAMHAAVQVTYGLPVDDDAEHAAQLDQIDASALARFAKAHFIESKRVQVIVGPQD